MNKYQKKCWSCDEPSMEPVEDYYKCTKCGATYNDTPRMGPVELETSNVFDPFGDKPRGRRAKHPTPAVQRRAAKARVQRFLPKVKKLAKSCEKER